MPIIAYLRAHGGNDFLLHFAFFEQCEKRGILDKVDFALDPSSSRNYCLKLKQRFPQLHLVEELSFARRAMQWTEKSVGRFYGPIGYLDRFDAVCEGCGGHVHGQFMHSNPFRHYQRTRKRAFLFQSIESSALVYSSVKEAVRDADLIIARSKSTAKRAEEAGNKNIVTAIDIVFGLNPSDIEYKPGYSVGLRLPKDYTESYINELKRLISFLNNQNIPIDYSQAEPPLGNEMNKDSQLFRDFPHTNIFPGDDMYIPFSKKRDLIISQRLHTTLFSLIHGNTAILQFQIQEDTSKVAEILSDIGLSEIKVHKLTDFSLDEIQCFLDKPHVIHQDTLSSALDTARQKVKIGMDAFEDWVATL